MRTLNYKTRFIELASEVNAEMPRFVAGKVRQALNAARKAVNGSRVLVLGVAYKRDVEDMRESPAVDVMKILEREGAEVVYHDPYVPSFVEDGHTRAGVKLTDEELESADAVLIVTDHASLDMERIFDRARILVDSRNATGKIAKERGLPRPLHWIVKGA